MFFLIGVKGLIQLGNSHFLQPFMDQIRFFVVFRDITKIGYFRLPTHRRDAHRMLSYITFIIMYHVNKKLSDLHLSFFEIEVTFF